MAKQTEDAGGRPQEVALLEALEALEKVKVYMLQQEREKRRMSEEHARLHKRDDAAKANGG